MKKLFILAMAGILAVSTLVGCTGENKKTNNKDEKVVMVWYPNESGGDYEEARNAVGKVVEEALGKKVEHKLTTDYSIAIETIANNNAHIAFTGAQGYVEARAKNDKISPIVVPSGASGTLDDAVYYSWLGVNSEKVSEYKEGENYDIKKLQGKRMSFVSNSSTSGFVVPTKTIKDKFKDHSTWGSLTNEDLMKGGKDSFFSEVSYGGSHQGALMNLLTGKSDVAAFCDTILINYIDVVSGEFNKVGTNYKIKNDAAAPFNTQVGKEFTVIESTPVLNSPFVMNETMLTEEEQKALINKFTSTEVTNNEEIFINKESNKSGFFTKTDKECFLAVEDSWFNPLRNMGK